MPSEVRKLKQLQEENTPLRKLVADLTLDKEMLTEVIKKRYDACSEPRDNRLRTNLLSSLGPACLPWRSRPALNLPPPPVCQA